MNCRCNEFNGTIGNDVIKIEKKYLDEIAVDAKKWKTLYKCKICGNFFEEIYTGGRWDGLPKLVSVTHDYVLSEWKNAIKNDDI